MISADNSAECSAAENAWWKSCWSAGQLKWLFLKIIQSSDAVNEVDNYLNGLTETLTLFISMTIKRSPEKRLYKAQLLMNSSCSQKKKNPKLYQF